MQVGRDRSVLLGVTKSFFFPTPLIALSASLKQSDEITEEHGRKAYSNQRKQAEFHGLDPLAARANVGAALSHDQPPNGGTASWASLALSIINAKVILEIPSSIDPVDAGPVAPYAFPEDPAYRPMEADRLHAADAVGDPKWVQPSQMESLIRVNVAHPGKESLVKQQRF